MFYAQLDDKDKKQIADAMAVFSKKFSSVYAADNVIALGRSLHIRKDKKFIEAFVRNAITDQEKSILWRIHTLAWAAKQCLKIPGDFVECGVWKGFSFSVITNYLDFDKVRKKLYLYDTYNGFPEGYNSENHPNEEYLEDGDLFPKVCERFAKYKNVHVIKGTVPDSFSEACPQQISLLHIDMNSAKSEIAALEYLYDRIPIGGMIIFDDFGWTAYKEQAHAEIAFLEERGQSFLELITGQGLVIKS